MTFLFSNCYTKSYVTFCHLQVPSPVFATPVSELPVFLLREGDQPQKNAFVNKEVLRMFY